MTSGLDYQDKLTAECSFPLLQDTEEAGAWEVMNGSKDDFYIYRADGTLAIFLPTKGEVETNLSLPDGYANLRDIVMAAQQ